jgi:Domain of unknown function (DUF4188)
MKTPNPVVPGRMTAQLDGDFVVFLIGMRVNKWWLLHKWLLVFRAMPPMLKLLKKNRELGLLDFHLAYNTRGPLVVQYWASFEQLEHFARSHLLPHLETWRMFNRRIGYTGDVGFWHETYLVQANAYETVYGNMPRFGLAAAGRHVPAARRGQRAAQRLGREGLDQTTQSASAGGSPAYDPATEAPGQIA